MHWAHIVLFPNVHFFFKIIFWGFPLYYIETVDRHERGREMGDDTQQRAAGWIRTPAAAGLSQHGANALTG